MFAVLFFLLFVERCADSAYAAARCALRALQHPKIIGVSIPRRVFEILSTPFTRLPLMIPMEIASARTHYARPHTGGYFSGPVNLVESALECTDGIVSALYILLLFKVSMSSLWPQANQ
jgi:hypothetical protein